MLRALIHIIITLLDFPVFKFSGSIRARFTSPGAIINVLTRRFGDSVITRGLNRSTASGGPITTHDRITGWGADLCGTLDFAIVARVAEIA